MEFFILFILAIMINPVVGYVIGNTKGRPHEGMWLGFLLGPLGWLIVTLLDRPQPLQPVTDLEGVPLAALQAEATVAGSTDELFEKWERAQNPSTAEPAVAAAPPSPEVARLERLRDLFSQGLITDDEYASKRQQILAGM